jgi:hypothetical protein
MIHIVTPENEHHYRDLCLIGITIMNIIHTFLVSYYGAQFSLCVKPHIRRRRFSSLSLAHNHVTLDCHAAGQANEGLAP